MSKKAEADTKSAKGEMPGATAGKAEGSEKTVDKALKNKDAKKSK